MNYECEQLILIIAFEKRNNKQINKKNYNIIHTYVKLTIIKLFLNLFKLRCYFK